MLLAALSMITLMGACGENATTSEPAESGGDIRVTDAWARSPVQDKAAVYFVITNEGSGADRLVGANTPDVDAAVSLHETVMQNGTAEMQPVEGIDIAAGETITLEPGGYHVMLENLTAPLEVGSTINVVLTFEQAGDVQVEAEVREFVEDDGEM
jgi:hypothetical protein